MNLKGKTAIITGGGRGIGRAIAIILAQSGANVVINSATDTSLAVAEDINANGGSAIALKGDVRDLAAMEALIDLAVATYGGVDILVNNAGITKDTLIMRMSEQDWDDVLDTNLKGAYNCIKAACRPMFKQKSGSIINITSVVGIMGNAGQANYAASKAGLIGLTKSIAKEFAPRGINCNAIAPGFIESDMTDKIPDNIKGQYLSSIPLKRFGKAEEIGEMVAFLASESAKYITGQVINVDGGLYI